LRHLIFEARSAGGVQVRGARFLVAAALVTLAFSAPAAAASAAGAPAFDEGERLFRENKPAEAAPLLEKAILDPATDERAWLYLALSYQQLGRLDEASAVLRKGLGQASRFKYLFYYDLGNIFALQGKNSFAADMYGQSIGVDSSYAPAFLNRANARLAVKDYGGAREDYGRYLELEPGSAQKGNIQELLKRLDAGIAETERIAAEAEARRQAEETARKELVDRMSASLKAAADETTSISAGAGNVQGYGDDIKLDE
jgi:tetratricopeptide (TPR) repeat protein